MNKIFLIVFLFLSGCSAFDSMIAKKSIEGQPLPIELIGYYAPIRSLSDPPVEEHIKITSSNVLIKSIRYNLVTGVPKVIPNAGKIYVLEEIVATRDSSFRLILQDAFLPEDPQRITYYIHKELDGSYSIGHQRVLGTYFPNDDSFKGKPHKYSTSVIPVYPIPPIVGGEDTNDTRTFLEKAAGTWTIANGVNASFKNFLEKTKGIKDGNKIEIKIGVAGISDGTAIIESKYPEGSMMYYHPRNNNTAIYYIKADNDIFWVDVYLPVRIYGDYVIRGKEKLCGLPTLLPGQKPYPPLNSRHNLEYFVRFFENNGEFDRIMNLGAEELTDNLLLIRGDVKLDRYRRALFLW